MDNRAHLFPLTSVAALRQELSERARAFALARDLPHALSYGNSQTVCFEPHPGGHGNFIPASYRAILKRPGWNRRLLKVHTHSKRALPPRSTGRWCELDSSNSSDALLMNIFCYPGLLSNQNLMALLGVEKGCKPEFGFKARVPLANGRADRTEVDLKLGSLLIESKLTESDFQRRSCAIVGGYKDFAQVFDPRPLPRVNELFSSYQVIRNILAAYSMACSFCLLFDARRPDLKEAFFAVLRCVNSAELRSRCKLLSWQELKPALPPKLRSFISEKYGI